MNTTFEEARRNFELGLNLFEKKDFSGAEEKFVKALSYAPDRPSILVNLSATLLQLGKWSECEKICQKTLTVDPKNYEVLLNLSACFSHQYRYAEAIEYLDKAISINPNLDQAWTNKGNAYLELGQLTQATTCFEKAISINASSQEALIGRGNLRNEKKDYQLALADFDAVIKLNQSNAQAKWNKALSLLRLGNFSEGWKLYESRWEIPGMREHQKHLNIPLWLGKESIKNKTILVYAEQGYGDTIQFSRYLPLLEKMGAKVFLEVPKPLIALMKTLSKTICVVENRSINNYLLEIGIDFRCPIMSLALAFDTTLETIPNQSPYLYADQVKSNIWGERLKLASGSIFSNPNPFRIGITWNGSGHFAGKKNLKRDLSVKEIAKLIHRLGEENIEFHSLQVERQINESLKAFLGDNIFTYDALLKDFSDTAALMDQMNLIVSIDTATAHLAGALNKPTILLIPDPPDFMALINRTDNPWYPSTSIIRQQTRDYWPIQNIVKLINEIKKTTPKGGFRNAF